MDSKLPQGKAVPLWDYLLLALVHQAACSQDWVGCLPTVTCPGLRTTQELTIPAIVGLIFPESLLCAGIPHPLGAPTPGGEVH